MTLIVKNRYLVKIRYSKSRKHIFHFILVLGAKLCGNEDFGVSILDPKIYSLLNLYTQRPSFYLSKL